MRMGDLRTVTPEWAAGRLDRVKRSLRPSCAIWVRSGPSMARPACCIRRGRTLKRSLRRARGFLPKDVELTIRQNYSGGLDETDLQILRAIRDSILGANEMQPQAVLDHVLKAIRAYDASPVIDAACETGPK